MINYLSDELALCATIDPQVLDAAGATSDWVDMGKFDKVMFVVNVIDASADTTVDAKIQSADDSTGTNNTDISGLAITQFTAAATGKEFVIEVRADQLNTNDTHVALVLTAGNGTVGITCSAIGVGLGNQAPASGEDLATVQQIERL